MLVVAGAALVAAPAAAQHAFSEGPPQLSSDAVAATLREAPLTVFDAVTASVNGSVVTLAGKVTKQSKREAILRRVERMDGVQAVEDHIAVLPDSRSDDELRERIARSIYGHTRFWGYAMMSNPPIRIIVENGQVTLTGSARNSAERALARALAMQSGARSVQDEIDAGP